MLCAGTGVPAAEPVRMARVADLALDEPDGNASHAPSLELYTFHGRQWTRDEIATATRHAARLLSQCAVALTRARYVTLDVPTRYHYYRTSVSRELLRRIDVSRPAVFFVADTPNRPAFDAEAIGTSNSRSRPELVHTVWVAYGMRDLAVVLGL
jgi:predicted protein tyrosine phosphatase